MRFAEERFDVVVVGAGIIGLAHAAEGVRRGLRVAVVERDEFARGASVRNFGHGCVSGQAGAALGYAKVARERWLELGRLAGFFAEPTGSVVVARREEELAVLAEFAAAGPAPVELLDADGVRARVRVPLRAKTLLGGAWLPWDVRVNPREAVGALADWLAGQGVTFFWRTAATDVEEGLVHTSRGDLAASAIVLATGHDLDWLFPDLAEEAGVRRCALRAADAPRHRSRWGRRGRASPGRRDGRRGWRGGQRRGRRALRPWRADRVVAAAVRRLRGLSVVAGAAGPFRRRAARPACRRHEPDVHPAPGRRPDHRRHPRARRHPSPVPGRMDRRPGAGRDRRPARRAGGRAHGSRALARLLRDRSRPRVPGRDPVSRRARRRRHDRHRNDDVPRSRRRGPRRPRSVNRY
ncbi:FAD-dependent oxidoreductase [Pseudofrankia saprophytica]|uniref:FAD-dependent oxidoreductase n=1 Tax=Pseudofrankia saprophytica TaxID=298655 RepID=UPI0031580D3B